MGTYLFIAFVLALAIAPLTHFMPTRRQREVAAMRESAAIAGLFVELRPPPGGDRAPRPPSGELIYYGLRLSPTAADSFVRGTWLRDKHGWRSVGQRLAVPEVLHSLPEEVHAAAADGASCGVYWVESGGVERVAQLCKALTIWAQEG